MFKQNVHFISGKGGVGKSVISRALARAFAKKGFKTLLVLLGEEEKNNPDFLIAQIVSLDKNLFFTKINASSAIYEYLNIKIKQKKIFNTLISHDFFRSLCVAMPGLSDLTRLGKIWYHADEKNYQNTNIFQKIVIDMPSSGYTEKFLTIASEVERVVKVGPLARKARLINEYLFIKKNAVLHLVTLPKELVVNETLELLEKIKTKKFVDLGQLFINFYDPRDQNRLKTIGKLARRSGILASLVDQKLSFEEQKESEVGRLLRASKKNSPIYIPKFTDIMAKNEIFKKLCTYINI